MATWNTTYNFNQYNGQSMNFGKAMLYGAFGQITGMFGGGCFGGGYGMGMGSYGMGMGGSLFSMMGGCGGFGGYGMYGYGIPDSYVGAQCALTATNVLFSAIGTHLTSRRTEKAAAQTTEQQISAVETEANTYLTKLKSGLTLEDYNSSDVAKYYDVTTHNNKISGEAISQANTLSTEISTLNDEIEKINEEINKLDTNSPNYQNNLTTKTNLKKLKEQEVTKKQTQQNNLNNINVDTLTSAECTSEKFGTTAAAALLKLVQAKEARKEEVDNAVKKLNPLKTKYNKLVAQQENEEQQEVTNSYKKAMGKSDYKDLFNYDDNKNVTIKQGANITTNAYKRAVYNFTNARKGSSNQKLYAKMLVALAKHNNQQSPKTVPAGLEYSNWSTAVQDAIDLLG